jgi:DNA-binding LacI/PurR family transcriptional regulator
MPKEDQANIDSVQKRTRTRKAGLITEQLLGKIKSGEFTDVLPGIDVLSEEFGVNRKTVNRAVLDLVSQGVLVRHPGRGTYLAGKEPSVPVTKKQKVNSRRYAFLIAQDESYAGYLRLLDGCDEVISSIGGLVFYSRFDQKSLKELKGRLRSFQTEGVIVCSQVSKKVLTELSKEFNVVTVDYKVSGSAGHSVVWENESSGQELGYALADRGCTHVITFFTDYGCNSDPSTNHLDRIKGLGHSLAERGITSIQIECDYDENSVNKIDLDGYRDLDYSKVALVIYDYTFVTPLLAQIKSLGIDPACVATFGDQKVMEGLNVDYLVNYDMKKLGREAASLLLDILGRPRSAHRNSTLSAEVLRS